MDPSLTDPQAAAVWNPPELNYTAPATNPAPNNGHNYPSYPEMITAAIGALREKDGSSRQAIAKYIEQFYTNLPADNAVLLTRHLKCMKQAGQLVMVKHSYALPGSVFVLPQSAPIGNGSDAVSPNSATMSKRRPGRPSKPKPESQLVVPTPVQDSVFVSLGLMDESVDESVDEDEPADDPMYEPTEEPMDEPTDEPMDVHAVEPIIEPVLHQESAAPSVLGKRGRGRPPKAKSLPFSAQPAPIDDQPAPTSPTESKRKPGRPRKIESVARMMARLPKKLPNPSGTPRGRPRKYVVLPTAAATGEAQAAAPVRRRGRKKGSVLKKKKTWSGKPLGRPRKIMLVGSVNQQVPANDDLVKKLEQIQAKIKQVVNVVKPHLDTTTTASACQALQELEHLAWQNLYAPFNIEVQLPVLTAVAASPSVLAPSQEPVLVQPPAHFAAPSSVPIADPQMFPASYQQFQGHYQGH